MNWPEQLYIVDEYGEARDSCYDHFLKGVFGKKNRRSKPGKTPEEKAARKENRKAFWGKIGQGVKDSGGVDGILGSVGNFIGAVKGSGTGGGTSDFRFGLGAAPGEPEKKETPVAVWVLGGIAVLAIGGFLVAQYRKKQDTRLISNHETMPQP